MDSEKDSIAIYEKMSSTLKMIIVTNKVFIVSHTLKQHLIIFQQVGPRKRIRSHSLRVFESTLDENKSVLDRVENLIEI